MTIILELEYSAFENISTFEKVTGKPITYQVVDRRPGDIAVSYADPTKAKNDLYWIAKKGLTEMCQDYWRW